MSKFRKFIDNFFTKVSLWFLYIYQKTISPDKWIFSDWLRWTVCRHEPHCSQYAKESLSYRWFLDSAGMITSRVANCKPWYDKIYDPARYKVVFASSSDIWLPFLEEIIDNPWFELVWIVTQNDKPGHRWLQNSANPIKKFWQSKLEIEDIPLLEPTKLNPDKSEEGKNFAKDFEFLDCDFFVVISYGKIIPQKILDIPKIAPINIHGSVLPKYRGASPIQTTLINGDKQTGITIMLMDAKLDEWDIIDILPIDIKLSDNSETIINKFGIYGPKFMSKTLIDFAHHDIHSKSQDHTLASFTTKITKEDAKIDIYTDKLSQLYQKYQWYYLWPKVRFELNNKRFIIENMSLHENMYNNKQDIGKSKIYSDLPLLDTNNNLNICVKNILIKPEGKKSINFASRKNWYLKNS